jgi:hypothetical protein
MLLNSSGRNEMSKECQGRYEIKKHEEPLVLYVCFNINKLRLAHTFRLYVSVCPKTKQRLFSFNWKCRRSVFTAR